jgi:hypothetical protein
LKINSSLLAICLFIFSSCAKLQNLTGRNSGPDIFKNDSVTFDLTDKNGQFRQSRDTGYIQKSNDLFVKSRITSSGEEGAKPKVLEQLIVVSNPGVLSKKVKALRPKVSQYVVWLEGERFFSELKVNVDNQKLDVTMKSNEPEWNGKKSFDFPKGTGVFCFFAQLYECVSITGFFDRAESSESGEMNFHVIWEGYPYFSEQYSDINPSPFARANLKYDGKNPQGEMRFTLSIDNQSIFYFLDKDKRFSKMFWVAQGLSMTRSEFQK